MSAGYDLQHALCSMLCTVGTCVRAIQTSLHLVTSHTLPTCDIGHVQSWRAWIDANHVCLSVCLSPSPPSRTFSLKRRILELVFRSNCKMAMVLIRTPHSVFQHTCHVLKKGRVRPSILYLLTLRRMRVFSNMVCRSQSRTECFRVSVRLRYCQIFTVVTQLFATYCVAWEGRKQTITRIWANP